MNKDKLLELGLTEEQADKVVAGYGVMIPKSRLDDKIEELKEAQNTVEKLNTQFEELKPKLAGQDSLLEEINKLQEANKLAEEQYQKQLTETKRTYLLESALKEAKVRNVKAIKGLLELDKVELGDNGLNGLQEQLDALKESDSYLFNIEQPIVEEKPKPSFSSGEHNPPNGEKDDPFAKILASIPKKR